VGEKEESRSKIPGLSNTVPRSRKSRSARENFSQGKADLEEGELERAKRHRNRGLVKGPKPLVG